MSEKYSFPPKQSNMVVIQKLVNQLNIYKFKTERNVHNFHSDSIHVYIPATGLMAGN